MYYKQYTKEDIENMSIADLKSVDIQSKEEEDHIQSLLNKQLRHLPPQVTPKVFTNDQTDPFAGGIMNPEQEKEKQREMDEYNEMIKRDALRIQEEEETEESEKEEEVEESEKEEKIVEIQESEVPNRFCEHCSSKGGRHKKDCTRELVAA